MRPEDSMTQGSKRFKKLALLFFGLAWILVGIRTLFEPTYFFRGAYVDFTGYNKLVGSGLIIVGTAFICVYLGRRTGKFNK
jgi:hypothetical protein